jgi:hypothetical protein
MQLSSLVVKINLFKILFSLSSRCVLFLSSHHDGNRSSVGWSKRRPPLTRKRDRVIVSRKTFRPKSLVLVTFSTAIGTRIISRNWTLLEENRSCAVTFVSPLNDWKLDAPMRCELNSPINRRLLLLNPFLTVLSSSSFIVVLGGSVCVFHHSVASFDDSLREWMGKCLPKWTLCLYSH